MRDANPRSLLFWTAVLAVTTLLAGLAFASGALAPEATATPKPSAQASTTPEPASAGPILSDARGFVTVTGAGAPASLRRETDTTSIASLRGQGWSGAVSGTGRRVAYWITDANGARELRVFDTTAPDQDTTLGVLPSGERGVSAVWSTDRTGVLIVAEAAPPVAAFSALRVVDAPTRSMREVARLEDGSRFWPVGWDRDAKLAGACIIGASGDASAYIVVREDGENARTSMDPGIPARTVRSSGGAVLGVMSATVIRVWSIASFTEHRELAALPGDTIAFARWRNGSGEIVVSIADRLELWPSEGGDHRVLAHGLPMATDLLVSNDGTVAYVSSAAGRTVTAVDLVSGRTAPVPMAGEQLLAAVSFR